MSKRDSRRRMLNFPFIYNFLEVELRGCNHDLQTMIEHSPLTVRYLIYSIPKAKCRPGHLNVNLLNIDSHTMLKKPFRTSLASTMPCFEVNLGGRPRKLSSREERKILRTLYFVQFETRRR